MALDPGIQSMIDSFGSGGGGNTSTSAAEAGGLTLSQIQQMLLGTARASVTSQPLGAMPSWVPPQLKPYVATGALDPYLGTGQSSPGQADPTWKVYLGGRHTVKQFTSSHTKDNLDGVITKMHKVREDKVTTIQAALNEPLKWTPDEVAANIKKFQAAGFKDVTDFDSLRSQWGSLVERAGGIYSMSAGKRKVTPWDVLDMYKDERLAAGTMPKDPYGPGGEHYTGNMSHIQKSVSDISEGAAWSTLNQALTTMLGREPSSQELRDFSYRMNTLAAHNPSITKTIAHYSDGINDSDTSHVKQGFTSDDLAMQAYQHAQADPNYAEHQAATTYFNAAISALGAIGG